MKIETMSFEEFTDALYAAGWVNRNDAQHDRVLLVYQEWMMQLHLANVATEYWRLMAETRQKT